MHHDTERRVVWFLPSETSPACLSPWWTSCCNRGLLLPVLQLPDEGQHQHAVVQVEVGHLQGEEIEFMFNILWCQESTDRVVSRRDYFFSVHRRKRAHTVPFVFTLPAWLEARCHLWWHKTVPAWNYSFIVLVIKWSQTAQKLCRAVIRLWWTVLFHTAGPVIVQEFVSWTVSDPRGACPVGGHCGMMEDQALPAQYISLVAEGGRHQRTWRTEISEESRIEVTTWWAAPPRDSVLFWNYQGRSMLLWKRILILRYSLQQFDNCSYELCHRFLDEKIKYVIIIKLLNYFHDCWSDSNVSSFSNIIRFIRIIRFEKKSD